jgi:hypothetical protein
MLWASKVRSFKKSFEQPKNNDRSAAKATLIRSSFGKLEKAALHLKGYILKDFF